MPDVPSSIEDLLPGIAPQGEQAWYEIEDDLFFHRHDGENAGANFFRASFAKWITQAANRLARGTMTQEVFIREYSVDVLQPDSPSASHTGFQALVQKYSAPVQAFADSLPQREESGASAT